MEHWQHRLKGFALIILKLSCIEILLLKCNPETSEYAEVLIIYPGKRWWQYPPDKIYPEYMEDIVDAGTQFEVCIAIECLKIVALFKIEWPVGRREAAP